MVVYCSLYNYENILYTVSYLGADGYVRVWDLGTSNILCEYPPPKITDDEDTDELSMGAISSLSFSQDGALLAASLRNSIRVYDTRKFTALPSLSDR